MTTTRTTKEIRDDIKSFGAQFRSIRLPAGTPDRRKMQSALYAEAHDRSCLPKNIKKRNTLHAELTRAKRAARAASLATQRKNDPEYQLRQWIYRKLRSFGFKRETVSGTSAYYQLGNQIDGLVTVRISDHDVPMTAERAWNVENGGFSWATSGFSHVVTNWMDAARFLVEVRREVR